MKSRSVSRRPATGAAKAKASRQTVESPLDTIRRRLRDVAGDRPFISLPEAGAVLGWSRAATYRAANLGTLPATRTIGRNRKVSVVQLERFIIGGS